MRARSLASAIALSGLAACADGPGALLHEAAGAVSQTLCSKAFISGLAPAAVMRDHFEPEPGFWAVGWAMAHDVDRTERSVRVRLFGAFEREARFRPGRGCTLAYPGIAPPEALTPRPHAPALLPDIAGPEPVAPADPALAAALDAAFREPAGGAPRRTQAVLVLRGGRVIAERYPPGLGPGTPRTRRGDRERGPARARCHRGGAVDRGRRELRPRTPTSFFWLLGARGSRTLRRRAVVGLRTELSTLPHSQKKEVGGLGGGVHSAPQSSTAQRRRRSRRVPCRGRVGPGPGAYGPHRSAFAPRRRRRRRAGGRRSP